MSTEDMEHYHEFDDLVKAATNRINEDLNGKVIDGVGADAEVVTNSRGGKQSKSPMAMHLLDPNFLINFTKNKAEELEYEDEGESICVVGEDIDKYRCYRAMEFIGNFMLLGDKMFLQHAMYELNCEELQQIISIAKVLQYGALRYKANNWRLIPQEEHINHALIHIIAHLSGDTQDDHLDHALCRLMMAYATDVSEGFNYNKYISKDTIGNIEEMSSSHPDFKPIVKCSYKYDCHYKE